MIIGEWLRGLADMIWPATCLVCGRVLPEGEKYICGQCMDELPRTLYHMQEHSLMEQRFAGIVPFVRATSWLMYSRGGAVSGLVHDFKYHGLPSLAEHLGEAMGRELAGVGWMHGIDIIEPVPMHWRRRSVRGYNQAWHLAKGVSRATGIPVGNHFRAVRSHKTQTAFGLDDRTMNLHGVFGVREAEDLRDRGVLLIDDVCTTGATLLSMAEALYDVMPDCRIHILTLASTV